LVCDITKKLDVNNYSCAHITLILALHYIVECRSRSLTIYNNKLRSRMLKIIIIGYSKNTRGLVFTHESYSYSA